MSEFAATQSNSSKLPLVSGAGRESQQIRRKSHFANIHVSMLDVGVVV